MDTSRRNLLKLMPALALAPFCAAYAEEAGRTQVRINIPGPHSLPFLPIELIPILGTAENLKQDAQLAVLMMRMLRQSVEWIFSTNPSEIVKRLDLKDQEDRLDLIDVPSRNRGIYVSDVFSQAEDTAKFMLQQASSPMTVDVEHAAERLNEIRQASGLPWTILALAIPRFRNCMKCTWMNSRSIFHSCAA